MKKFVKEKNPFLLVSFIFSVIVFLFIGLEFATHFNSLKNIMNGISEYYVDLSLISFYVILFIFFVLILLFNIIGYVHEKVEYIVVAICLLVILSFMFVFDGLIVPFLLAIIWGIINVIGLIKIKKKI